MKKADAQRQINWRVKIIKHASEEGNVARTCRPLRDLAENILQVDQAL